jgi:hypothetical protein
MAGRLFIEVVDSLGCVGRGVFGCLGDLREGVVQWGGCLGVEEWSWSWWCT